MRLTCLKCGHQVDLAFDAGMSTSQCVCGTKLISPVVFSTGVAPHEKAAERSRRKAFRAAGVVKNVGGFALGISFLGILFFPIALVGAAIGVYGLTMLRGPVGRYSGRRQAAIAIFLGAVIFIAEGALAVSWFQERHRESLFARQDEAIEDLKRLRRTESLYRANHGTYGGFEQFKFRPAHGSYTIYLAKEDVFPAWREGQAHIDPLPPDIEPGFSRSGFTAVAIANIDGDDYLDVWIATESRAPRLVRNDVTDSEGEPSVSDRRVVQENEGDDSGDEVEVGLSHSEEAAADVLPHTMAAPPPSP